MGTTVTNAPRSVATGLTLAVAASAAITIAASLIGAPWVIYVFKPLTTLLLVALAIKAVAPVSMRYRAAVAVGLVFSLAGDVFLMLPGPYFLHGLIAFLLAHIAYLRAFTSDSRFASRAIPFVVVGMFAAAMLFVLWPKLPAAMKLPVLGYVVLLGSMTAQAVTRHLALRRGDTLLAAIGGVLFLVSDATLAFDRFHTGLPLARLWVLGTYFAAQLLIARSVSRRP